MTVDRPEAQAPSVAESELAVVGRPLPKVDAEARIELGAVASLPFRVHAGAAAAAATAAKPLQNTDLTLAYRKRMVRVFVG